MKGTALRSRHLLLYLHGKTEFNTGCQVRHCDREPSRISVEQLTHIFKKRRLSDVRKRLNNSIKKSVSKSSQLHVVIKNLRKLKRTRCIPDVYCPTSKSIDKRFHIKFSTKHYIAHGILADIFFNISCSGLHA
jgi:hypothetical protein